MRILFFLLIIPFTVISQETCGISKVIGDADNNQVIDTLIDEANGAIYMVGLSSTGNGLFIKTNISGAIEWIKEYENTSRFSKVIQAENGDFLLLSNPSENIIITRVDSLGNFIWSKTYSSGRERAVKMIPSINDTYIVASWYTNSGTSDDVLVMRIDSDGNILWSKRYHEFDDQLEGLAPNGSGGCVLTGTLVIFGGNLNLFVFELDADGNLVIAREFDFSFRDDRTKIIRTSDNGYLLSGITVESDWDIFCLKLNADLSFNWSKKISTSIPSDTPFNSIYNISEDIINNNFHINGRINDGGLTSTTLIYNNLGDLQFAKEFPDLSFFRSKNFESTNNLALWSIINTSSPLAQYGNNDIYFEINNNNDISCQATNILVNDSNIAWNDFPWVPSIFNFSLGVTDNTIIVNDITFSEIAICEGDISISLGEDTTLCEGDTLVLDATTAGASYVWQDGSTNPTFTVSEAGTFSVTVTVDSCNTMDEININYASLPSVDLGSDTTLCEGDTLVLDATTADASYVWHDGSTNPTFTVSEAGTFSVTITVDGCTAMDDINVNYIPLPNIDLGSDVTLCEGEILVLDATITGATYTWQDGSTNSTFTVSEAGAFSVVVTLDGCTATDEINVNYTPLPNVDLGSDMTLCEGENLVLDASATGASYVWQDGSTNSTFTVLESGTFSVAVTIDGCTTIDEINVSIESLPELYTFSDLNTCITVDDKAEFNLILSSSEIIEFEEIIETSFYTNIEDANNDINSIISFETYLSESTTIYVRQENLDSNCYTIGEFQIIAEDCEVFIPSGISPNGDGKNDVFNILNIELYPNHTVEIFNRNGRSIYKGNNSTSKWNGTFNGKKLPSGTYFYIIQLNNATGNNFVSKAQEYHGWIYLNDL